MIQCLWGTSELSKMLVIKFDDEPSTRIRPFLSGVWYSGVRNLSLVFKLAWRTGLNQMTGMASKRTLTYCSCKHFLPRKVRNCFNKHALSDGYFEKYSLLVWVISLHNLASQKFRIFWTALIRNRPVVPRALFLFNRKVNSPFHKNCLSEFFIILGEWTTRQGTNLSNLIHVS